MHCHNFQPPPLNRRQMLRQCAGGFGAVALSALMKDAAFGASSGVAGPHFDPKVRSVIFLYMDGGVSQVDSFDPKPRLAVDHGKRFAARMEPTQFNDIGTTLKSPWKFHHCGKSGIEVSDLFPQVGRCVDDLVVIRSMIAPFSEHEAANFFLHTGFGLQGYPSAGAWIQYGLGSECQNLPGFVVLNGGLIPSGGLDNFGSGFLPASCQGSLFQSGKLPVANIVPRETNALLQQSKLELMRRLDEEVLQRMGRDDRLETAISNYETAFRMQTAVPDLVDLSQETAATHRSYGLQSSYEPTRIFGRQCLLARRLVERGVRFVELTCPVTDGNDRWDAHVSLVKNHSENALAVDQPMAALIVDLKQRGMLEDTLVVWAGEFGRTPFAQGSNGRDHSPLGFSIWLCGGGLKRGIVYGATDEFGYHAVQNRTEVYDLHATILYLLGLDHRRLTYRFSGRDMRLTDVHGEVIEGILDWTRHLEELT